MLSGLQLLPSIDPLVHLKPLSPGLHLGLSTHLLPLGSTLPPLHRGPSSLRLQQASHPSGYLLVSHHPGSAMDIQFSGYASSLHPARAPTGSSFPPAPPLFSLPPASPRSAESLSPPPPFLCVHSLCVPSVFPLFLLRLMWLS